MDDAEHRSLLLGVSRRLLELATYWGLELGMAESKAAQRCRSDVMWLCDKLAEGIVPTRAEMQEYLGKDVG
jgi:hypothetical protein